MEKDEFTLKFVHGVVKATGNLPLAMPLRLLYKFYTKVVRYFHIQLGDIIDFLISDYLAYVLSIIIFS